MKNADLPAMPIPNGADGRPWTANDLGNPAQVIGLTKREMFAMAAMQGLLSSTRAHLKGEMEMVNSKVLADMSVFFADALLAELEK